MAANIVRNIWWTTAILLGAQFTGGGAVMIAYGVLPEINLWYNVALIAIHATLGAVLAMLSDQFVTIPEHRPLNRVNIANLLSMIRISSAPTLVLLVVMLRSSPVLPVLVPFAALVFLTDLVDGLISRRSGTVTRIGQFLDSSSDYVLLIVVSIALAVHGMLPTWFLVVLALRLGLQIIAQAILYAVRSGRVKFRSSLLGKASVFSVMLLYALAFLGLARLPSWYGQIMSVFEYVVAAILSISLAEKLWEFATDLISERRA